MTIERSFEKKDLWHDSGSLKVMTDAFVAGDTFHSGWESLLTLDVTLGGADATTVVLQLNVSFDCGVTWREYTYFPNNELDGTVESHIVPVNLIPNLTYQLLVKKIGGDGTSTALVKGTTGIPQDLQQTDQVYNSSAYDEDSKATRVLVLNGWNKYGDGGPLINVVNQDDDTYFTPWIDLDGVRIGAFELTISGTVVVTMEGTCKDEGSPPASGPDITLTIFGAASYNASDIIFDIKRLLGTLKYVRFQYVSSGGAGTGNLRIDARLID